MILTPQKLNLSVFVLGQLFKASGDCRQISSRKQAVNNCVNLEELPILQNVIYLFYLNKLIFNLNKMGHPSYQDPVFHFLFSKPVDLLELGANDLQEFDSGYRFWGVFRSMFIIRETVSQ